LFACKGSVVATDFRESDRVPMKSIKENVEVLIDLQEVESKIAAVESRLSALPQQIQRLDERLRAAQALVDTAKSRISDLQKTYRDLEADAGAVQGRIAKSNDKLHSVKTNKEYQSSLKEIDDLKQRQSEMEDRMLECLEEMDAANAEISQTQKSCEQFSVSVANEKEALRQASEIDRAEMERLNQERDRLLGVVDPSFYKKYASLKQLTGSTAVALVKNGTCLGCHLNIPPQLFNELQRMDKLQFCPHCHRMVYPKATPPDAGD
jgi:predicted  nucleic acid-binding Zn-ribbon protein